MSRATADPTGPPGAGRHVMRRADGGAVVPVAAVLVFLALVVLGLSGTSIGVLAPPGTDDPALVAGEPRTIRGDESQIMTPLAVSAARQGFPESMHVGLTDTRQAALAHGAPTASWVSLLKPQDWGFLLLGPERGLAWRWWAPYLASVLGLTWLLRRLGVGVVLAGALAVAGTFTPYQAWWSAPAPGLVLGFGSAVGAALLASVTASTPRRTAGWAVVAGLLSVAFALVLYPPWQVSVVLVVAGCVIGVVVGLRVPVRRLLITVAGLLGVVVPLLGVWFLQNREAIQATVGTVYPGQRSESAGGLDGWRLLSAPLNPVLSGPAGDTLVETNLSEISSTWLPVPAVLLALALVLLPPRRGAPPQPDVGDRAVLVPALVGVAVATGLLLAWAFLPLPDAVGLLGLQQVPPGRTQLALGLGVLLVIAVCAQLRPWPGRHRRLVAVGVVAATTALTVGAAWRTRWDGDLVPVVVVALLAVTFGVVTTAVVIGPARRGAAVVGAVLAVASFATVNPLYAGLGRLDANPVTSALRPLAQEQPGARTVVFSGPSDVALVRAAGLQSLSGVTFYPDRDLMEALVPLQERVWNNYSRYDWVVATPGVETRIEQVRGSRNRLVVDPCSADLVELLDPVFAYSVVELDRPCLQSELEVQVGEGRGFVYRYSAG